MPRFSVVGQAEVTLSLTQSQAPSTVPGGDSRAQDDEKLAGVAEVEGFDVLVVPHAFAAPG